MMACTKRPAMPSGWWWWHCRVAHVRDGRRLIALVRPRSIGCGFLIKLRWWS